MEAVRPKRKGKVRNKKNERTANVNAQENEPNAAAPSLPGVTTPAVQMVEEDKGDHCTDEHVEGGTASAPQPHGAEVCGLVALPSQLGEEEDDDSGIRHEPSLQRPDQLGATQLHYAELQDNFDNTTADSESCAVPPGAELIEATVLAPAIDTSTVQPGVETIEATVLAPANDTSTVQSGVETIEATVLAPANDTTTVHPGSAVDSTVTEGNAMCATVTVPRNYAVMAQETDIVAMEYLSPSDASTLSFQAHDIAVQSSQEAVLRVESDPLVLPETVRVLLGTDQVSDGLPSMAPDVQDCAQVVEMQVTTDDAAAAVASAPLQSGTEQIGTVVPELQSAGTLEMAPFSERELAAFYCNSQLEANAVFVDNFILQSKQENHPLYALLLQYLKANLAFTTSKKAVE
eukprot:Em1131g1a